MKTDDLSETQRHILEAGRQEFLQWGYSGASLRSIAGRAGVTTGAFYGYYKSKAELFDDLVGEAYHTMMRVYSGAQNTFAQLPESEQPSRMGDISGGCMDWMVGYIYRHWDAFKLLVCCAQGTKYEHMIHQMVEIEVEATHKFFDVLRRLGHSLQDVDPQLEHILVSGMFSAYFEIVVHDMPEEQAVGYVKKLREFYTAGWMKLMDIPGDWTRPAGEG